MRSLLEKYIVEQSRLLLEGRKERYMDMFKKIIEEDSSFKAPILSRIEDAINFLKKDDRIIWYLLRLKISYIDFIVEKNYDPSFREQMMAERRSIINKTKSSDYEIENIENILEELQHSLSLPIQQIQNYIFKISDQWFAIRDYFTKLEEEWKKKTKGKIKTSEYEGKDWKTLIKFPDGKVWILLNQNQCSLEARAMGHCGNAGDPRPGERILSLRTLKNDEWEVHLTFILDSNGMLGEMKGRGNDKPAERYHPYIVKLLEDPIVKGIKGGGYLENNNFSLDDLPEEVKEKLLNEKDGLGGWDYLLTQLQQEGSIISDNNPFIEMLNKELKSFGLINHQDPHLSEDKKYLIFHDKVGLKNIFRKQLTYAVSNSDEKICEYAIDYYLLNNNERLQNQIWSFLSYNKGTKNQAIDAIEELFSIKQNINKNLITKALSIALANNSKYQQTTKKAVQNWINRNNMKVQEDGSVIIYINLYEFLKGIELDEHDISIIKSFSFNRFVKSSLYFPGLSNIEMLIKDGYVDHEYLQSLLNEIPEIVA